MLIYRDMLCDNANIYVYIGRGGSMHLCTSDNGRSYGSIMYNIEMSTSFILVKICLLINNPH